MTEAMPREPHEGIKADANVEAQAAERGQSPSVARGGSSGAVDAGPAPADEQPSQAVGTGTASGDPVAGVTASAADVEAAVPADTGPEHPGQHG